MLPEPLPLPLDLRLYIIDMCDLDVKIALQIPPKRVADTYAEAYRHMFKFLETPTVRQYSGKMLSFRISNITPRKLLIHTVVYNVITGELVTSIDIYNVDTAIIESIYDD